jgi:nucleoside-diphosphate-sugar epimerase
VIRHHTDSPAAPRRVVVLGASGFVGTALMKRLREQGIPTLGLRSSDLDLTSADAVAELSKRLRGGDAVVIAAALTPEKGNDVRTLMRNLRMAETLASLDSAPCQQLVYLSSDAVYDISDTLIHTATRPAPPTLYGHMHLLREKIVADAAQRWGCPMLVLRPCAIYGPGDTHNSYGPNRFFRTAVQQQRIVLFGHGEELRDHVYIDDLVQIIELALWRRSEGLLNAATGHSVSFHALATTIAGLLDQPVTLEYQARRTPISHRHFDIADVIRAFPGFRFTHVSAGLSRFLDASEAVRAA